MTTSKIQMDQIRSTSATVTGENIRAGSQKKSSLSPAEGLQGASPDATCTCPSGDGSLRHPCPAHPAVEQAGGDERAVDGKPRATKCPDCGKGDLMPGDLCACGYETDPAAGYACSECDGSGDGCVGEVCRECDGTGWFVTPEQARATLAQPSPAQTQPSPAPTLRAAIDVANDRFEVPVAKWGTDLVGEEERPEVAEVAFVLRNIGAMDAEDIDGDNVDLRFEDAEGRDTGCDVSIVEYAEKAADLFEQHDRIVGELRADRDSWAEQAEQRLADWDEMRKERDAALARVAELERQEPVAHLRASDLERLNQPGIAGSAGSLWNGPREGFVPLYAAPVAQAQHSVPETTNEEANSFLRVADAGQFKDNAAAVRTAAMIIRGLLHRPAIMKSIIRHRIGLTPEYEGQWHADMYGEDGEVQHHAEADTPDEAVRAVVALAAAPGKEGV
ncbi:hypothetical protein ACOAOQ_05420 [Pseudomonas aeruginosa]